MKRLLNLFIISLAFIVTDAKAACSGETCCTVSSGVTTAPDFSEGSCDTEPASYGITIYEKYLCTSIPTVPADGTAYNLDVGTKCFRTLHNPTGATVDMAQTDSGLSFDATFTRPPDGVYTHGVMVMKNEFRIKQDMEFTEAITGDAGGTGKYCVSTSNSGHESANNSLSCSATDGATPGTFTSILRTFSGSCSEAGFTGSGTHSFTSGDVISAWLLDTNNEIADDCTEAAAKDTLFGVQTFATPVVVTELTSGFNMAFGVSSGSSMFQNGEGGTHSVGSGPFKVLITPLNY